MVGELETKQIASLLAQGATCEQIAGELGFELAFVKLIAARQGSETPDRDITDDDLAILRRHAFQLALGADDDATQARMTMFLLERDKPSKNAPASNPIALINNAIINANGAFEKLVASMNGSPKPPIIEQT